MPLLGAGLLDELIPVVLPGDVDPRLSPEIPDPEDGRVLILELLDLGSEVIGVSVERPFPLAEPSDAIDVGLARDRELEDPRIEERERLSDRSLGVVGDAVDLRDDGGIDLPGELKAIERLLESTAIRGGRPDRR